MQKAAVFYDRLFASLDFTLPAVTAGRRSYPKEAMFCAFIVMKYEGFSQIMDLEDGLDNDLLIVHYCGFIITKPLPSYWTYDRFLVKPTESARALMPCAGWELPYPGAKEMLLADNLEDRAFLKKFMEAMYEELSFHQKGKKCKKIIKAK